MYTVNAVSVLLQRLFGTICQNSLVLMTLVVENSFVNWRHSCLCGPTCQRRLWERSLRRRFINGLTYLPTYLLELIIITRTVRWHSFSLNRVREQEAVKQERMIWSRPTSFEVKRKRLEIRRTSNRQWNTLLNLRRGDRQSLITRNTFCGTWYLPHSRVYYDRQCHFSMRMCETALLQLAVWNLTVETVKMVNLRHRVKFCGDRSNRCWDMAIFRFFKMAAAAILDF